MNVLMVYPEIPDTFWSFKHALRFIKKKASNPPLGLVTVAAMLPHDWQKKIVDLNVENLKNNDIQWADMIMVSAMNVQRTSARKLISRCKESGKVIVAGGPLFTAESGEFTEVDHFVLNEAEITLPLFLGDLAKGTLRRYYSSDEYADISLTPIPAWNLLDKSKYDSLAIQFSRGCPFNCDFCNVTALLGHTPRTKQTKQIIDELNAIYDTGWRRNIFFVDDNFIGNKKILKQEILPALIEWRKGKQGCNFVTEASINLSDDEQLMSMMTEAGFISVFVGIETPDEASLSECNKKQNSNRDLIDSVKRLQRFGFNVMGGFIVGFDSDKPGIFQKQVEFIQNSGIVTAMVGLLQAPFGTELHRRMLSEGRLTNEMSGDNTDGSTNIIPKMNITTLKDGYKYLVQQIYSPDFFYQRVRTFLNEYKPIKRVVHLDYNEISAFFRSIFILGIFGRERLEYWRLFFWSLFKHPDKFPMAITFSIMGYHFRKISESI